MVEEEGAGDNSVKMLDISGNLVLALLIPAPWPTAALMGGGGGGGAPALDPDPGGVGILDCLEGELDPNANGPGDEEDCG